MAHDSTVIRFKRPQRAPLALDVADRMAAGTALLSIGRTLASRPRHPDIEGLLRQHFAVGRGLQLGIQPGAPPKPWPGFSKDELETMMVRLDDVIAIAQRYRGTGRAIAAAKKLRCQLSQEYRRYHHLLPPRDPIRIVDGDLVIMDGGVP